MNTWTKEAYYYGEEVEDDEMDIMRNKDRIFIGL
jgi:hypothetical protein